MRIVFTLALFLSLISGVLHAQVDPLYSQYLNNPFLINPAYTGMNNYMNLMVGYRKQWAGFDGSPTTLSATGHTSLFDNRMGVGLIISQDKVGENTNTFIQGTYAYKVRFDDYRYISFGLQAGIMNFRSDNSELNIADPSDPLFNTNQNVIKPSFGAGAIFRTDNLFIGVSVPRILKASESFEDVTAALYTQHYYGFASYLFLLSDRVKLKPAVLVRAVSGSPLSTDVNFQFNIDERYAIGALTRNFNTYGFLAQIKFNEFRFGYVFEMPTNKSVGTRFTSHEITLGLNLGVFNFHDVTRISDF
ncbi:MAG: type IX secretion system membrane protein PorP/SprF [Cyclobacteriaceae bacterium]|nr:type IX secretion system membrane protein PorP/SprF [Cyclobacteriaceae bacterium]UYN85491.1 MAG: type IX secretion system membrane protein PorP/SprF [Cyclobacteriaceae bacterium]